MTGGVFPEKGNAYSRVTLGNNPGQHACFYWNSMERHGVKTVVRVMQQGQNPYIM